MDGVFLPSALERDEGVVFRLVRQQRERTDRGGLPVRGLDPHHGISAVLGRPDYAAQATL
jgi:hypothetical protein